MSPLSSVTPALPALITPAVLALVTTAELTLVVSAVLTPVPPAVLTLVAPWLTLLLCEFGADTRELVSVPSGRLRKRPSEVCRRGYGPLRSIRLVSWASVTLLRDLPGCSRPRLGILSLFL